MHLGTINITLRLNSHGGADPGHDDITLTNIKYNVADTTPTGSREVKVNGLQTRPPTRTPRSMRVTAAFGPTRFDTAADIAEEYNPDKCADEVVVSSTATDFPDGAVGLLPGLPILMVNNGHADSPDTLDKALDDFGVGQGHAVGGTAR